MNLSNDRCSRQLTVGHLDVTFLCAAEFPGVQTSEVTSLRLSFMFFSAWKWQLRYAALAITFNVQPLICVSETSSSELSGDPGIIIPPRSPVDCNQWIPFKLDEEMHCKRENEKIDEICSFTAARIFYFSIFYLPVTDLVFFIFFIYFTFFMDSL